MSGILPSTLERKDQEKGILGKMNPKDKTMKVGILGNCK
jgi:hypothetical protein